MTISTRKIFKMVQRQMMLNSSTHFSKVFLLLEHLKTLKLFLQDKTASLALIFEDDNAIPAAPAATRDAIDALAKTVHTAKWSSLNLSPCFSFYGRHSPLMKVKVNEKETLSLFPVSGCCANAYFVTRDGAAFMVANTLPLQRDSFALTFSRMVASKTTKPRPATVDHMFAYEPRSMEVHPRLLEQTAFLQSTGGHLYEAREYWNNGSWVSLCGMLLLFVVLAVALLCLCNRRRRTKIT